VAVEAVAKAERTGMVCLSIWAGYQRKTFNDLILPWENIQLKHCMEESH